MIRDRIICGVSDSGLRERLLRVADLDLEKMYSGLQGNWSVKGAEQEDWSTGSRSICAGSELAEELQETATKAAN